MKTCEQIISELQPHGLIIIRGLPGSGKSTLAHELKRVLGDMYDGDVVSFEADNFFVTNHEYKFDPKNLHHAHNRCKRDTDRALDSGDYQYVIVSNTFVTMDEIEPYLKLAEYSDNLVTIINMKSNYGSIHNVPAETIEKMAASYIEINSPQDLSNPTHEQITKVLSVE